MIRLVLLLLLAGSARAAAAPVELPLEAPPEATVQAPERQERWGPPPRHPKVDLSRFDSDEDRDALRLQLRRDRYGWGSAFATTLGVQVVATFSVPFRAWGSLSLSVGNVILLAPAGALYVTASEVERELAAGASRLGLADRLRTAAVGTGIAGGVSWALTPLAVLLWFFVDPGVGMALEALPVTLTSLSVALTVQADRLRGPLPRDRFSARRPQLRLVLVPGALAGTF